MQSGVRFIRPYSLANVAQRNCLDMCIIPTINGTKDSAKARMLLQQAHSGFRGGWFESTGSGYHPSVQGADLASAYPYVLYHLSDIDDREEFEVGDVGLDHFGRHRKAQQQEDRPALQPDQAGQPGSMADIHVRKILRRRRRLEAALGQRQREVGGTVFAVHEVDEVTGEEGRAYVHQIAASRTLARLEGRT